MGAGQYCGERIRMESIMTTHLSDITLIELAGGQLSNAAETATLNHLSTCRACAQRYHEVRQTWDLLGQWDEPVAALEPIPFPAESAQPAAPSRFRSWRQVARAIRVAAAVGLAAGLGASAGWLMPSGGRDAGEIIAWQDPTPWQIWHEPTPARLAEPMLSLVLEPEREEPSS